MILLNYNIGKEVCQELPRCRPIAVSFYDGIEIFPRGLLHFILECGIILRQSKMRL